jgi:HD superfamily phosphohydrolase
VKHISSNKRKIFNDPVYGFINIPNDLAFDLIENPYFQRLRRIKQLGLTYLVYTGAMHTRFQHAMGALHLMMMAVETLKSKGNDISSEEENALYAAILLHDIGHGPSHALENSIVHDITHEDLSEIFMNKLNIDFQNRLNPAIQIFQNSYHKKFLHQLVSSQLDMDRLDYLMRDSYYTGVSEGVIGYDRIIKMLTVVNDQLVIEAKGIYSIEKFIISRRLMYWQVYFHKTVIAAETLLVKILKRAKELAQKGEQLFATPALRMFLYNNFSKKEFLSDQGVLKAFAELDDYDIYASIKVWVYNEDYILSSLCKNMNERNLFRIELQNKPFKEEYISNIKKSILKTHPVSEQNIDYFFFEGETNNSAYDFLKDHINILYNDGQLVDISEASDQLNYDVLSKSVTKHFICYPKNL